MHLVKYVLPLAFHLYSGVFTDLGDFIDESGIADIHLAGIHDQHHVEESLDDGLGDVHNIDLVVCQIGADLCDDADGVLANDCNDYSVHVLKKFHIKQKERPDRPLFCSSDPLNNERHPSRDETASILTQMIQSVSCGRDDDELPIHDVR